MPPKRTGRSLAAARRMAGKKGGAVALQVEVNNDEDWEKMLEKEGLIVVDVYSEWCGPCLGMVGNLKKLKLEIGSDYLHLAVAKSDGIDVLTRFRNKSEPTWMFIGGGEMVHVMFGANAPKLMRTIQQELDKELKAMKGEAERQGMPFTEMTPEEKARAKVLADKLEAEKQREEKELADKLEELKIKSLTRLARKLPTHTLALYFPHMIEGEKRTCTAALKMMHKYDSIQLMIIDQQEVLLTPPDIPELFYNAEVVLPEKFTESITTAPCLVTLLLGIGSTSVDSNSSLSDILGKVEEKLGELVYGKLDPNNPLDNTPASNYQTVVEDEVWPGIWTPLNYLSKASAVKILFPNVVRAIGHEDDKLPPPMYVIIFEASRAREISEVIEEFKGDVMRVGYFDSIEADTAKRVCRRQRDLERMPAEKLKNTKMVMSIAKTSSDPLLAFSQLGPVYISPDLKIGTKEAVTFFPSDDEDEGEGGDDEAGEDYDYDFGELGVDDLEGEEGEEGVEGVEGVIFKGGEDEGEEEGEMVAVTSSVIGPSESAVLGATDSAVLGVTPGESEGDILEGEEDTEGAAEATEGEAAAPAAAAPEGEPPSAEAAPEEPQPEPAS